MVSCSLSGHSLGGDRRYGGPDRQVLMCTAWRTDAVAPAVLSVDGAMAGDYRLRAVQSSTEKSAVLSEQPGKSKPP